MFIIGVIIVIAIIIGVANGKERKKREQQLKDAEQDYRTSLLQLKRNPTNADLKQKTLALGRFFSNLTRERKGVTVYDEMAIMNDINAACAASSQTYPLTAKKQVESIEQRLKKLKDLKDKDLITDKEFESRREKILNEI